MPSGVLVVEDADDGGCVRHQGWEDEREASSGVGCTADGGTGLVAGIGAAANGWSRFAVSEVGEPGAVSLASRP